MYINVNFSQFCDSFSDTYKNNFSYEGKRALFDYIEQTEESMEDQTELDPVALCCTYTEYESFEALQADYPNVKDMEELKETTTVIDIADVGDKQGHFIIEQF